MTTNNLKFLSGAFTPDQFGGLLNFPVGFEPKKNKNKRQNAGMTARWKQNQPDQINAKMQKDEPWHSLSGNDLMTPEGRIIFTYSLTSNNF